MMELLIGIKQSQQQHEAAIAFARKVTIDQLVKHMTDRFLAWPLPDNFKPDGGISFTKTGNIGTSHEYKHRPSGTNLLDAAQAEAMFRYLIEDLPTDV